MNKIRFQIGTRILRSTIGLIVLLFASAGWAESPPQFDLKWGSFGTAPGFMDGPEGVAIDLANNVWVADTLNNRIQKFDSSGNLLFVVGGLGEAEGQFKGPRAMAVDGAGNLYVADTNNMRIQKFTDSGAFLLMFGFGVATGAGQPEVCASACLRGLGTFSDGGFIFPEGVATGPGGEVYVAGANNPKLQKFNSSGSFVLSWGVAGTGAGEFSFPLRVAVDSSGDVYVTDNGNARVQVFDSTGVFLRGWGSPGTGDGEFNSPVGIAIDTLDKVYVVDQSNNRVQKFDSSGNFLTQWGSCCFGDGQFNIPRDVAVDSIGNIYVTDRNNDRIQKFAPDNDTDDDGIPDGLDNCPIDANPLEACTSGQDCLGPTNSCLAVGFCSEQNDNDGDLEGDICDSDDDNDGTPDIVDNCPIDANPFQEDDDFDGLGNACDATFDGDTAADHVEDVASDTVTAIASINVSGGNGMISKLTGNGGVTAKVTNAVDSFEAGLIDLDTYIDELVSARNKLDALENQVSAKINNGKIVEPEASALLALNAEMRVAIESLIANP